MDDKTSSRLSKQHCSLPSLNILSIVLQHCACWLSPTTWTGMAIFRQVPWDDDGDHAKNLWFESLSWKIMRVSILAAGVGRMLLTDGTSDGRTNKLYVQTSGLVVWMIVTNPHVLLRMQQSIRYAYRIAGAMRGILKLHSRTMDDAVDTLATALDDGRAHRTRHYTVYWPTTDSSSATSLDHASHEFDSSDHKFMSSSSSNKPTKLIFILFLPGLGVSDVAYAPPLLRLLATDDKSQSSTTTRIAAVAVVATDPLRVPSPMLGYNADYLRRTVMQPVEQITIERRHGQQSHEAPEQDGSNYDLAGAEWIVMGHSLGSLTAASIAAELNVRKVVLWGPAPYLTHVPNLVSATTRVKEREDKINQHQQASLDVASSSLRILVVQGSRDGLVRDLLKGQPDAMEEFWKRFPADRTQRVLLDGGTHAGFASYTPVFKENTGDDEEKEVAAAVALLTRDQQQEKAVQATLNFLQS